MKSLLYSHVFLAFCAASMTADALLISIVSVFENIPYLLFVFISTLLVYNIKGLLFIISPEGKRVSPKISWAEQNKKIFLLGYLISILLVGYLFFYKLSLPVLWISPFVILSLLYSLKLELGGYSIEVRRIPFAKTILVAITWTFVVAYLPLFNAGFLFREVWRLLACDFLFLLSLSILFDIKDAEVDADQNLKTLPVALGYKRTKYASMFLMGVRLFILDYSTAYFHELSITIISLILLFLFVKRYKEEQFYMFFIDGIMVLKLIVSILFYF